MKLTKSLLRTIIKEEIARSLLNEAEEQVYGYFKGEKFKLFDQGDNYLLISCGDKGCSRLGTETKKDFKDKLKLGKYKAL